jgi:hypothetical protein
MTDSSLSEFKVTLTTKPYAKVVHKFYQEYVRVFGLFGERETLVGFRESLRMNGRKQDYGQSCEYIGILETKTGQVVAGFNFVCFPMPQFDDLLTIHSVYIFVLPEWRGHGLLHQIYQVMEDTGKAFGQSDGTLSASPTVLFFGEQNDPFKMSIGAHKRDAASTNTDQFDRVTIWNSLGARILLFPYVQPALSPHGKPDKKLFLRVIFRDEDRKSDRELIRTIDPRILYEHLRRFFYFPVLKGRIKIDMEAAIQFAVLHEAIATNAKINAVILPDKPIIDGYKYEVNSLASGVPNSMYVSELLNISSMAEMIKKVYHVSI